MSRLHKDRLVSARLPGCPQMPVALCLPSCRLPLADTYKGYVINRPFLWCYRMIVVRYRCSHISSLLTGTTYTIRRKMNVHPGEVYNVLTLCRCSPLNSSNHAYTLLCSLSCYAVVSREPKPYDQASKSPNTLLTTYSSYCTKIIPPLCVYEPIRMVGAS